MELTDEQLGAYVDGELDAPARSQVEQLLALDPDARRRLRAIQDVTLIVRAATAAGPRAERPHGPVPRAQRSAAPRGEVGAAPRIERPGPPPVRAFGWLDWRIAASFVAGALVLLGVLELGGEPESAGPAADWHASALAFHDMYLRARANEPPDTMLDILRHQPDEVAQLISFSPSMPDLAAHGYEPAGAHLISGPEGPIVYVAFENAERPPIVFAMTRGGADQQGGDLEAPRVQSSPSGVTLVSWSAGEFEYGLGAALQASELMPLVDTARQSLSADEL